MVAQCCCVLMCMFYGCVDAEVETDNCTDNDGGYGYDGDAHEA